MTRSVSLLGAVLLLTGSTALFAQGPASEKLASGNYVVYAISPQAWRFTVDPKTAASATLTGHYSITEGTPKDIDVYVFKDDVYFKWRAADPAARANLKPVYSSLRKSEGDLNVKVTEPGNYYVIFSNLYQYQGIKKLTADVKLQYDKH
jgi:hypothetical protein